MGKPRTERLGIVEFRCGYCAEVFQCPPERVEDDPDRPWHPFSYFCTCPQCDHEAQQSGRERGLLKAWANATGPRTDEGKATVTKNIEGHPTPEEALVTRFNAIKTGLYSEVANYYPAKPGQYGACNSCEYFGRDCAPGNDDNPPACLKRTELFMKHQAAFDANDPGMLTRLRAGLQSAIHALMEEMLMAIMADGGPRIKSPEWYYDKEGGFHLARYRDEETGEYVQITKLEAHPLLKPTFDLLAKNNLTLEDLGMTPKVQDENDILRGHLDQSDNDREKMEEFQQRIEHQQTVLFNLVNKSHEPALIEDGEVVDDG